MACPFFEPAGRIEDSWLHAPRLPLGGCYRGVCRARDREEFEPPEASLRELCNCGYARGRCERFPPGSSADAVRFSIRQTDGAVIYILEKDHAPVEFASSQEIPKRGCLAAQIRAFSAQSA